MRCPSTVRVLAAFLLAVGLLTAGAAPATAAPSSATYSGATTTTIQLVDVYGRVTGTPTYRTTVEAVLSDAPSGDANPYRLWMQSTPLVNAPGEWSFASSAPVGDGVHLQYWSFTVDSTTGAVEGELTNPRTAEAIALNLITVNSEIAPGISTPFPYSMGVGTTITGTLDAQRFRFVIKGNTVDRARPFQIEGVLDRVT